MSQMQQRACPTVHVDSFLYSDEQVDSLCEEGAMSRNYCLRCGSTQTAPLGGPPMISEMFVCCQTCSPSSSFVPAAFISHSFSATELKFLFQNVLPDLSGRTLVDVGSRLGAVLYGVRDSLSLVQSSVEVLICCPPGSVCCCCVFVRRVTCTAQPPGWLVWSSVRTLSGCRTKCCRSTRWRTESRFVSELHRWKVKIFINTLIPVSKCFISLQRMHLTNFFPKWRNFLNFFSFIPS